MFDKRSTEKHVPPLGVESMKEVFIYALSEPFSIDAPVHVKNTEKPRRRGRARKGGAAQEKWVFASSRLPARALYKQKVESGVMAPVDGGCETEDKGRGSARRGRKGETEMVEVRR